jgi:hypothetical protein
MPKRFEETRVAALAAVVVLAALPLVAPSAALARRAQDVSPARDGIMGPNGLAAPRREAPATRPVEAIRALVRDLAAESPRVRDDARQQLLQLTPDDLPTLRDLVASGAAADPAQRDALYDVVRHVYLTADRPPRRDDAQLSFLGVAGPSLNVSVGDSIVGMSFLNRLPGFPAFGALRDGDLIVGVREFPSVQFNSSGVLVALREQVRPGQLIHFRVLRDSQLVEVPIRLTYTPADVQTDLAGQLRLERAEAYWERVFEPAFDGPAS